LFDVATEQAESDANARGHWARIGQLNYNDASDSPVPGYEYIRLLGSIRFYSDDSMRERGMRRANWRTSN